MCLVCTHVHKFDYFTVYVEIRGKLGVGSLLSPCGSSGLSSGLQAWQGLLCHLSHPDFGIISEVDSYCSLC